MLQSPSSFKLYSVYAGYYECSVWNSNEHGEVFAVVIDAAGQNSYGGTTRDEDVLILNPLTGEMILDLEDYGKKKQKGSFGANYIQALDIQNEALYL